MTQGQYELTGQLFQIAAHDPLKASTSSPLGVRFSSRVSILSRISPQARAPTSGVLNTRFYSHSGSQVPSAATAKESEEIMTKSIEEDSPSFVDEKPWASLMHGDDRGIQKRDVKHLVDDPRKDFAKVQSSVSERVSSESEFEAEDEQITGEIYRHQYVSLGLDGCNFLAEIIDVDHEAGFGEDEGFGGQEYQAESKLGDSTEGRPVDDEELSVYERYIQPRFSTNEVLQMNTARLELSLGGRYDDQYRENATETSSQVEEGHWDKENNASMHQNCTDQKWLRLGSSNGEEGLAHRDFWEEERLKVQLEEILMWQKKGRRMKHRMRRQHTSNALAMRRNSEHMDHVMRDILAELRVDKEDVISHMDDAVGGKQRRPSSLLPETNGNSYKLMIVAFEELLREVEATENKNRKKLDDVLRSKVEEAEAMQQERRIWSEIENQLRSRISSLEIQHGRMSDTLRETAAALTVEKERRKDSRSEVDKVMEMLAKEKKLHRETAEKLNTYASSFVNLREILAAQKLAAVDVGSLDLESIESILNYMDREYQYSRNHVTQSSEKTILSCSRLCLDIDEVNRLKQLRNAAEAGRDQIEERLTTLLRETREGHGEMETLWLEREKLLEQKIGCLQTELHYLHSKTKRKEAEVMIEGQRWADELEKCMQAWARERNAWEAKLKDITGGHGQWKADMDIGGCARNVVAGGGNEREEGGKIMKRTTDRKGEMETVNGAAHLESRDQACIGSLVLDMEGAVDTECDDKTLIEVQREKTKEWRRRAEQYQQERKETEKKLSAALILVTKLEQVVKAKEVQMEEETKKMEEQLVNKSAEVGKLKQSLRSKERDLEVTIQKFTDELKLIDKDVERERKEREQVMELHFASKRQLLCDIKAKEESWEKALEVRNNELQMIEDQLKTKQKGIEELKRKLEEEEMLRERTAKELQNVKTVMTNEMEDTLADIWKVCEDEMIQGAVAKKLLPGADLSLRRPIWESLWLEYCRAREISDDATVLPSTLEWEFARGKVARFEKQIAEAMSAIKYLRDEVEAKEEQLLKVKADREREWEQREDDWAQERERLLHLVDCLQQKEVQINEDMQSKEQDYAKKMEAMEELRKIEREEATAIISSLRVSTREWCLKRINSLSSRGANFPGRSGALSGNISHSLDESNEVVQVNALSLEELDRYIFDLESRKEAGDRSSRNSKTCFGGENVEYFKEEYDMNNALLQIGNEMLTTSESEADFNPMRGINGDGRLSPRVSREWSSPLGGPGASAARGTHRRVFRPLERGMCLTLNGLHTMTQESPWTEEADGSFPMWEPEIHKRLGVWGSFHGTSSSWMCDEVQSYPGSPARGCIALPAPSAPTRRPQKWMVDVSWLDQVRKEHAWLRQQLEIERRRVSALGRVEADNRWIEAAIIRALELKRQSDTKSTEMQRKLAAMETLFSTRKTGSRKS